MSLFRVQQGASSVTELFISFDCALASPDPSNTTSTGGVELFYQTQILCVPMCGACVYARVRVCACVCVRVYVCWLCLCVWDEQKGPHVSHRCVCVLLAPRPHRR